MVFEQELYTGFEYHMETPYFHTFEMNNILAGFSFADEVEADMFYLAVMECISTSSDQIIEVCSNLMPISAVTARVAMY